MSTQEQSQMSAGAIDIATEIMEPETPQAQPDNNSDIDIDIEVDTDINAEATTLIKAASNISKQQTVEADQSSDSDPQEGSAPEPEPANPTTANMTDNISNQSNTVQMTDNASNSKMNNLTPVPALMGAAAPGRTSFVLQDDARFKWLNTDGFTPGEVEFMKDVIVCCSAENGFDLYQLMAFDGTYVTRHGWMDWAKYGFNILKAVLCASCQVIGMILILIDFVDEGLESKDLCNPPEGDSNVALILYSSNLKILSFLFSSFLAYFSVDALMGVEQGMYRNMRHAADLPWINVLWLRIGFSVNVFVSVIAVYGSFIVIFFSDNCLDMVLNSVALFFIVELDNLLVKGSDYERILIHVQAEYDRENPPAEETNNSCQRCKRAYRCCCSNMVSCFSWMYTLPFQVVRFGTVGMCFLIPFYIGYCF